MRGKLEGCIGHRWRAARVTFGSTGPTWPRDVGTDEQLLAGAGPCVDAGKQTRDTGVCPDVQVLPVLFFLLTWWGGL